MPNTPPPPVEPESSNLTSLIQPVAPDENVSVSAGEPTPAPQPIQPNLTTTIPSETAPNNPDIERQFHEATWRKILGSVADTITGPEMWRVTRDAKTGEVSAIRDKASLGEKWGHIAAIALGGAAAGLANSQGPGGLAKAAAAGTQTGLEEPQKKQKQVNEQVDFENKQLLAKANRIHLTQQSFLMAQQAKLAGLEYDEKTADLMNKQYETLASSPNAQDLGTVDPSDPNGVLNLAKKNPDAMDAYLGKNNKVLRVTPTPDHKLSVVVTDLAYEKRKNTVPMDVFDIGKNAEGKMDLIPHTVPPGTDTPENIFNHNLEKLTKWGTAKKDLATAAKAEKEAGAPVIEAKTPEEAMALASKAQANGDTAGAQRYTRLATEMQQAKVQVAMAGRNINTPLTAEGLGNWGTLLSDPRSGVTLANVPKEQRSAVINSMATAGLKIAKPLTAQELNRSDLANNAIANIDEAMAILERKPDMFGPIGWGETKIQRLLKGGDPDAMAYMTAINLANLPALGIHGLKGKYALEDLAKLDSDLWTNPEAMRNILTEIRRSASEFSLAGGRNIPANVQGGGAAAGPAAAAQPAAQPAAAAGPAAAAPAAPAAQPAAATPPAAPPPARVEWIPNGPVFDAKIYMHVHPDKDVAGAIDRARKAGMNVINEPHK